MFSNLGLLMCLCWTLAFVAIYDSDDAFWYPFITFNSLQVGSGNRASFSQSWSIRVLGQYNVTNLIWGERVFPFFRGWLSVVWDAPLQSVAEHFGRPFSEPRNNPFDRVPVRRISFPICLEIGHLICSQMNFFYPFLRSYSFVPRTLIN